MQKFGYGFQKLILTKRVRCPHPQHAYRLIFRLPYLILQRQPAVNHPTGVLIAALAVIRQPRRVGGAQYQAHAQHGLKRL